MTIIVHYFLFLHLLVVLVCYSLCTFLKQSRSSANCEGQESGIIAIGILNLGATSRWVVRSKLLMFSLHASVQFTHWMWR